MRQSETPNNLPETATGPYSSLFSRHRGNLRAAVSVPPSIVVIQRRMAVAPALVYSE